MKQNASVRALTSFILFIVDLAAIDIAHAQTPRGVRIMEGYPAEIQARLKARDQMLGQALAVTASSKGLFTVQYFLDFTLRWDPGSAVTVAFSGGSPKLGPESKAPPANGRSIATSSLISANTENFANGQNQTRITRPKSGSRSTRKVIGLRLERKVSRPSTMRRANHR